MIRPHIVAIVGSKKSGKTTTVEGLIREFVKKKYKVGAVKHISERDFTIDTQGKDTWRFAHVGATTVVSVSANEVATVEKKSIDGFSIEELLRKCDACDFVFTEGFKWLVGLEPNIQKIVVIKSEVEVENALKIFDPILAFSGPCSTERVNKEIPYVNSVIEPEKLASIVEDFFQKRI